MAATKEIIRGWFQDGVDKGVTHMIVVCDISDYMDYPVYVQSHQKASEVAANIHGRNMQRVREVYDLSINIESQLEEARAWHI